jgi:hypothetical protein
MSTPGQHELRAWKIADTAASAWRAAGGDDGAAIPLGVMAGLSLVAAASEPYVAEQVAALATDRLAGFLRRVWGLFAITRPELAIRIGPFARWLDDEDAELTQRPAAWEMMRSVLATGELFTGDDRALFTDTDLLGCANQLLVHPRTAKARGETYTPPDVAMLLMQIRLAGARPGQTILDDGAGTGSLLRAAAQYLRDNGIDPRTMHWYASDIDPIAVAALAVNVHLWGLGPHVVITRADILTEPDWARRAAAEQEQALRDHDLRLSIARLLAAEHVISSGHADRPGQQA